MAMTEYRGEFPLLIAQVDYAQDEATGDFYYRTFAPGAGMAHWDGIHVVNLVSMHRLRHEVMYDADILILNNICDADLLPVIKERKSRRKVTVFELCDDVEALPSDSPDWHFYQQPNNLLLLKRLAHYCDALQFSSRELEKKYRYLNETCRVFPNQMLVRPPEREKVCKGTVVVGWGGSISHLQDIKKISGSLIGWIMSRNDVHLYLMCADEIWELFESLPANRKRHFPLGRIEDYYDFVSHLDIGIAPLKDTPFNRSRSDVKALEYAAHGAVPVVQATGPYLLSIEQGRTGMFFNTPDELISSLDFLVENSVLRRSISASAREYVLRERNYYDQGLERIKFYLSLVASTDSDGIPWGGRAEEGFDRLCRNAGAIKSGRHLLLSRTRYELLLQAGILASNLSDLSRARSRYLEAVEMEPEIYIPYLFGAFVSHDPISMLRKALEINPRSISSRIQLGKTYLSKGMTTEAIESFKAAVDVFPEYELPYIECANCLYNMGLKREGTELLRKAIDLIPKAIRKPNTRS